MNFSSTTHAQVEEPYTPVNKNLYPTEYEAWKDSVWTSIKHLGAPMDYSQNFSASYQLPLNLIPIFDWINTDASYSATYNWQRGTDLEDGTSLGNNISNNRQFNLNGSFSLEKLYNHIPFLKKTNERFNKNPQRNNSSRNNRNTNAQNDSKNAKDQGKQNDKEQAALPKNKKGFEKEITLLPDTTITVSHGKNSKKLVVSAKNEQGRTFPIKYKVVDQNNIRITTKVDSSMKLKLTVTPKEPHDDDANDVSATRWSDGARTRLCLRFHRRQLYRQGGSQQLAAHGRQYL